MSQPAVVLLVKFRSSLSHKEVVAVMNDRIEQFRALQGLTQKYYMQDTRSGEYAGLYLWESAEALGEFQRSELRTTIAQAYQTQGAPRIEVFRIFETLRD